LFLAFLKYELPELSLFELFQFALTSVMFFSDFLFYFEQFLL